MGPNALEVQFRFGLVSPGYPGSGVAVRFEPNFEDPDVRG